MLLLATERRIYVTPDSFGELAELIRLSEQSALMMVPTCLEIFGAGQFWDEFRANVLSSDQGQFFSRLGCLMLRQCRMEVDQLCDVLCKSPSLTMVELVDLMFLDEGCGRTAGSAVRQLVHHRPECVVD
ncbi:Sorting nexin-4 [Trichinella pseudospiralis]